MPFVGAEVTQVTEPLAHELSVDEQNELDSPVAMDPCGDGWLFLDGDVNRVFDVVLTLNVVLSRSLAILDIMLLRPVLVSVEVFLRVIEGSLRTNGDTDSGKAVDDRHFSSCRTPDGQM